MTFRGYVSPVIPWPSCLSFCHCWSTSSKSLHYTWLFPLQFSSPLSLHCLYDECIMISSSIQNIIFRGLGALYNFTDLKQQSLPAFFWISIVNTESRLYAPTWYCSSCNRFGLQNSTELQSLCRVQDFSFQQISLFVCTLHTETHSTWNQLILWSSKPSSFRKAKGPIKRIYCVINL